MAETNPAIILLFSGKRKSGKDYICEKLRSCLGVDTCEVIRISEPLKGLYASNHNLDLKELLSDSPYKEKYRLAMIKWSERIRDEDHGYFCSAACKNATVKPVWIISDIRRKTDIEWFTRTYGSKIRTVRISADNDVRTTRGYTFTEGVDDVASECDLDDYISWDVRVTNNSDEEAQQALKNLEDVISSALEKK